MITMGLNKQQQTLRFPIKRTYENHFYFCRFAMIGEIFEKEIGLCKFVVNISIVLKYIYHPINNFKIVIK